MAACPHAILKKYPAAPHAKPFYEVVESRSGQRLSNGHSAGQAWDRAYAVIVERRRKLREYEKEHKAAIKALSQQGWERMSCGFWEDPLENRHLPWQDAIKIVRQRLGLPEPKRKKL